MKHLIICREYPPAYGGGIGTYAATIARLLAENGETVHVIAQKPRGRTTTEKLCSGRLTIHRLPTGNRVLSFRNDPEAKNLFKSNYPPQIFALQAARLAEKIVETEKIDIIEAQEFEAPLFFFQLRRAKGSSSTEKPPCIIHLHSPTAFIAQHNNWQTGHPYCTTAFNNELYSIKSADALLCPGNYLAKQVQEKYSLSENRITVIPYPLPDLKEIQRGKATWEKGSVCYVGRLERRKGTIEWIDAAVQVAGKIPGVKFSFIGENVLGTGTMCGDEFVQRRIPLNLKKQFHFEGRQKREAVKLFLAKARIGVVPSRWENFPYACMEMMASGIPVIASPEGSMKEMITDGDNGWIAEKMTVDALAKALVRALNTPAGTVEQMGGNASRAIRHKTDHKTIIARHMAFKKEVIEKKPEPLIQLEDLNFGNPPPYNPKKTVFNDRMTLRKIISKIYYGMRN